VFLIGILDILVRELENSAMLLFFCCSFVWSYVKLNCLYPKQPGTLLLLVCLIFWDQREKAKAKYSAGRLLSSDVSAVSASVFLSVTV